MPPSNKKAASSSGLKSNPWHPNFRNVDELPDIKTVRTKFFINAGCVIVALGMMLFWLYTEYTIRTTTQELQSVETQISRNSKPSRDAITHYKTFKESEVKITELSSFLSSQKLIFSDFIIEIGQGLPDHVSISNIQVKETEVSVRGVVKSAPELASTIASAYEKQLRESPALAATFSSVSLASLSRESTTGFLTFEMILKFKK